MLRFASLLSLLLLAACGRPAAPDAASPQPRSAGPEDQGPRRGDGTEFDAEDRKRNPLAGVPPGGPDGPWEGLGPMGQQVWTGEYAGGKPNGVFVRWAGGKRVVQGEVVDGRAHGAWRWFYRSGDLMQEGRYEDGKAAGVWVMYRPDGGPFERIEFEAGEEHGSWVMYHPGGAVAEDMTWARGQQIGVQKDYDPTGRLIAEGAFEAHRPTGTWTCHDPGGRTRTIAAPKDRLTPAGACGYAVED